MSVPCSASLGIALPECLVCMQAQEAHKERQATQHRISVLKKQVSSRDRSLEDLKAQLEAAESDLQASEEQVKESADRISQLAQELRDALQEVELTRKHFQKGTHHQIETLRSSLAESRTDLEGAVLRQSQEQAWSTQLKTHATHLDERILSLEENLHCAHAQIDDALAAQDSAEGKLASVNEEASDLKSLVSELSTKLTESQENASTLEAGFEDQTAQLQELTKQLEMASDLGQQADLQQQDQAARLAEVEAEAAASRNHNTELKDAHEVLSERYTLRHSATSRFDPALAACIMPDVSLVFKGTLDNDICIILCAACSALPWSGICKVTLLAEHGGWLKVSAEGPSKLHLLSPTSLYQQSSMSMTATTEPDSFLWLTCRSCQEVACLNFHVNPNVQF